MRRRFGRTELRVSPLCQGTAFRTLPRADVPEARRVLARALEIGVNFFDSSNAYGWGGAEEVLGKAIAGQREGVVICTKVAASLAPEKEGGKPQPARFTHEYLFAQAEGSLRRMGTDYIDLYLLHQPDKVTPAAAIAEAMAELAESGRVRYWGVSNHSGTQLSEYLELKPRVPLAGIEEYYNIAGEHLDSEGNSRVAKLEQEVFPLVRQAGLGVLAFSPQDTGHLAPERTPPPGSPLEGLVKALDRVAGELGVTRPQVCIAWGLARSEVSCVLAGAESPQQVEENWAGAQLALPPQALEVLEEARQVYRKGQQEAKRYSEPQ